MYAYTSKSTGVCSTTSPVLILVVYFEASLFCVMVIVTIGEVLNNCCTCGIEKTLMEIIHQYLANILSRQVQAKNLASDWEDYTVFIEKRYWLHVGTMHCAAQVARVEACGLKLCNAQFSLGNGLGEIAHYTVSVVKMACWLLELRSV